MLCCIVFFSQEYADQYGDDDKREKKKIALHLLLLLGNFCQPHHLFRERKRNTQNKWNKEKEMRLLSDNAKCGKKQ